MRQLNDLTGLTKSLRRWLALGLVLLATSALAQFSPSNVKMESLCDDRLAIRWDPSSGASGYQIAVVTESGEEVVCDSSGNSCVIRDLKPDQTYDFYVDRKTDGAVEKSGQRLQMKGPNVGPCGGGANFATPTPRPPVDTCSNLPSGIAVRGYHPFSTQCQRVSAAGVGNGDLIARGILDAVDVWASVSAEIQVCFHQQGRLYFLDAATSPRAVSDLAAEAIEGMTCGWINRAGTVALVPGSGLEAQAPAAQPEETPAMYVPPGEAPYICQLVAGDILNLRGGGDIDSEILAEIPYLTLLVPLNRSKNWFLVSFEGRMGWVNRDYVFQSVGCNAFNAAGNAPMPPDSDAEPGADDSAASEDQAESPSPTEDWQGCTLVTGDILNLRAGPGLERDILALIPYQANFNALDKARSWFQVRHEGQTGWVHSDYVYRTGDCS